MHNSITADGHAGQHICCSTMQSNIDNTTNWALTDEEYSAITNIKHQLRLLDGCPWLHEVGPYRYTHILLRGIQACFIA